MRSLTSILFLLACDGAPAIDGGADAGDAGDDAAMSDGGRDAGPPLPRVCRPCRIDAQCGEGELCLTFEDGSSGCGRACASDADCADTIAATCVEPEPGLGLTCVPAENTCAPIAAGTACTSDADCRGTFARCVEVDARGSICTTECASDADCPFMFSRCAGGFCAADRPSSIEACQALIDAGAAEACTRDADCPGGTCHGSDSLRVCLSPPSGGVCPDGTVLVSDLCVPAVRADDVVPACACAIAQPGSMLDDALALIDRDRCEIGFPTAAFRPLYEDNPWLADIAQDPFRLSFTDQVHGDWLSVPAFARTVGAELDDAADDARPISSSIAAAARWADHRSLIAPPTARTLGDSLETIVTITGGTADRAAIDARVAALPAGLADRIAPLFDALILALETRERAIALHAGTRARSLFTFAPGLHLGGGLTPSPTAAWVQGAIRGDIDVASMAAAAQVLAQAIEDLELAPAAATLTIDTPAGRVAIRGSGDDVYAGAEWAETLLVLDLGGDDTYRVPIGANASIENGVSIAIDLGGADDYGYDEVPIAADIGPAGHVRLPSDAGGRNADPPSSRSNVARQGAGRMGIGMLIDLGPEGDEYRSLRMSQGYGALGVGVLYDEGGDDLYHGEAGVQGSASVGLGILVDRAGTDRYLAYAYAQGFAYTRAVGVLYDRDGADTYFTHPSDVLYASPQSPGASNTSMSQGAGFGRRADFTDGVFMSGGLGVLRDRAGNDAYTTSIFGQATGYWFGTGLLLDAAGDDSYDGEWYVQGASAHYAIAALLDERGNDRHNVTATRRNAAVGLGHDYSIGWLIDLDGDDVYNAPNLSIGAGNAGGLGVFADAAGADAYDTFGMLTFGTASVETPGDPLRTFTGTFGIFLDRGEIDTYVRPMLPPVANDAEWTQTAHVEDENEHGVGIDRSAGTLGILDL